MRPQKVLSSLMLSLMICCGCGGSNPEMPTSPAVPVKGKLTHRGKPVTKGRITLEPTDGGREARGDIQPDGTFVLSTFQPDDGALIGVHHVLITDADRPLPTKKDPHVRIDPAKGEYVINLK